MNLTCRSGEGWRGDRGNGSDGKRLGRAKARQRHHNRVKLQWLLHTSRLAFTRLRTKQTMARQKRSKNEYDEGDGFVQAEGSKKKVKSAEKVIRKPDGHVDEEGNHYWEVGHVLESVCRVVTLTIARSPASDACKSRSSRARR